MVSPSEGVQPFMPPCLLVDTCDELHTIPLDYGIDLEQSRTLILRWIVHVECDRHASPEIDARGLDVAFSSWQRKPIAPVL